RPRRRTPSGQLRRRGRARAPADTPSNPRGDGSPDSPPSGVRDDAACAVEPARVPAGHRLDADDCAGVRRMDEPAVADVDADMAAPVEEDEVAGSHVPAADVLAEPAVREARMRERDPEVGVHEADEAGAVESRARGGAAPRVPDADEVPRIVDHALAEAGG